MKTVLVDVGFDVQPENDHIEKGSHPSFTRRVAYDLPLRHGGFLIEN